MLCNNFKQHFSDSPSSKISKNLTIAMFIVTQSHFNNRFCPLLIEWSVEEGIVLKTTENQFYATWPKFKQFNFAVLIIENSEIIKVNVKNVNFLFFKHTKSSFQRCPYRFDFLQIFQNMYLIRYIELEYNIHYNWVNDIKQFHRIGKTISKTIGLNCWKVFQAFQVTSLQTFAQDSLPNSDSG